MNAQDVMDVVAECGGDVNKAEELLSAPAKIVIREDDWPTSPREFENLGVMCCWHRRYNLGDDDGIKKLQDALVNHPRYKRRWDDLLECDPSPSEWQDMAKEAGYIVLPLYLYDHSGITISTEPFSCPWDSGQVGFIFTTPEMVRDAYGVKRITKKVKESAIECLKAEVREYDTFLRGNVYMFMVMSKGGDVIDSCGGFIGDSIAETGMADYLPDNWRDLEIEAPDYFDIE